VKLEKTLILICLLTSLFIPSFYVPSAHATGTSYALIVCGTLDLQDESRLLYNTLEKLALFKNIYYLHENPKEKDVWNFASKANIRTALGLLKRDTRIGDFVFIYFMCHGGGLYSTPSGGYLIDGRAEVSRDNQGKPAYSDEGDEILEDNLMLDVNHDGDTADWVGVDECLWLPSEERYWDDELKADLVGINYSIMVIVSVSCFGGGFIDDLSGPNRIIITATKETSLAYRKIINESILDITCWGEYFISALDPNYPLAASVDANHDGGVTFMEAFNWAWKNDYWRQIGMETPWLDDNGDSLPTYIYMDDLYGHDGGLASAIYVYCHHSNPDGDC